MCLRRHERNNGNSSAANNDDDDDDDISIDVEGESYEEYEWAGQTRVRASSLLEGGYSAAGKINFTGFQIQPIPSKLSLKLIN